MVQGVKRNLSEWFENLVEDYMDFEKKFLFQQIKWAYEKHGPEVEKKIFKYIARYVMGRVQPPSFIDGLPTDYPQWMPLKKSYARRKGHSKKFLYSGNLIRYLEAKDNAQYWYKKPQVKGNYKEGVITYYSMFRDGRKAFTAHDGSIPYESKIQNAKPSELEEIDGDNALRPVIKPMEEFLLYKKLEKVMDERLKEILEEDYANEKFIPAASEF